LPAGASLSADACASTASRTRPARAASSAPVAKAGALDVPAAARFVKKDDKAVASTAPAAPAATAVMMVRADESDMAVALVPARR
jgi:hypothetical protein